MARYVRRGDYLVRADALREAKEHFDRRSKHSKVYDKINRASIEPELDRWKRSDRRMDFPGVDTPRERVRRTVSDEHVDTFRNDSDEVVYDPMPEPIWQGSRILGDIGEGMRVADDAYDDLRDAFTF